ncbi:MAG: exodeoxyribonuclease VII large subunit [Chloroflexi bacterium]|nr:exodeoxyribonuclease VII large subunit [Chloroflexota bacterium]
MTEADGTPADGSNRPIFTVGELSQALKRVVEGEFAWVSVRGEVSGFKRAASGHLYFSLKDSDAVLDAVCWRGVAGRLGIAPEDGLEVVATGKLSTYPGRSRYQIVVERLELSGAGALLALLEARKKALAEEGLFDDARKRALPYLPERVGVVTSPTGAVIRDILHRLGDRFPRRVLVWPVKVQGAGAAEEIAVAIEGFNRLDAGGPIPRPDVLIVARGGGSLEDLWAFNEEVVVRAAAASGIPLISAVGHETDVTLIDLAADRRAPTPTAAAEIAVPVRADLLERTQSLDHRLSASLRRQIAERRTRIDGLGRGLPAARDRLTTAGQRLDDWSERLARGARGRLAAERRAIDRLRPLRPRQLLTLKRQQLAHAAGRLAADRPTGRIAQARQASSTLAERLARAGRATVSERSARVETAARLLEGYSYRGVLARGYAVVRDQRDHPLTSAAAVKSGAALSLEFQDGRTAARAAGRPKPRKPKSGNDEGGQASLL